MRSSSETHCAAAFNLCAGGNNPERVHCMFDSFERSDQPLVNDECIELTPSALSYREWRGSIHFLRH